MPTTLVTGASSGIGKVFAERFAKEGHDLVIVARRQAELEALAERLRSAHGRQVHVLAQDLTEPGAAQRVFDETTRLGLSVTGLVNNAGFGAMGRFERQDPPQIDRMLTLNISVLAALCRVYLPGMLEGRAGFILNVASTAAFQPVPFMTAYAATKSFVLSFSEALAEEVRDRGVKVVALCPGPTRTEFVAVAGMDSDLSDKAPFMTAEAVVDAGMQALAGGEVVKIAGFFNALAARVGTLLPRPVIYQITKTFFKPADS
jgi:hypothetical protein